MEEDIDFALYYDVEKAIDYAFEGKFVLKMYDYLKICNAKRRHADAVSYTHLTLPTICSV